MDGGFDRGQALTGVRERQAKELQVCLFWGWVACVGLVLALRIGMGGNAIVCGGAFGSRRFGNGKEVIWKHTHPFPLPPRPFGRAFSELH